MKTEFNITSQETNKSKSYSATPILTNGAEDGATMATPGDGTSSMATPHDVRSTITPIDDLEGTMVTHDNMTISVATGQDPFFIAGFSDCAQQAINYLIEIEKMDENDPVVVGLKQHLMETQQRLGLTPVHTAAHGDTNNNDGHIWGRIPRVPSGYQLGILSAPCGYQPAYFNSDRFLGYSGSDSSTWLKSYLHNNDSIETVIPSPVYCSSQESQISELTGELIDLLSECSDWENADVSDSDEDDAGWSDVVEDMELTW